MKVAVLGGGPCGLLVAEAADQLGHPPVIYSNKLKSVIPGSQYLHAAIPRVTPIYPEHAVQYVRMGTREGYAEKVYGDAYQDCGWPVYDGVYQSWSVQNAYERLWRKFSSSIVDTNIRPIDMPSISRAYDVVLSTIPQKNICGKDHAFEGVPYWIQPRMTPREDQHREIAIYNGLPDDAWYRWSILGGKESIESTRPLPHSHQGIKATSNNCDCWPEIHRLGRWAKWQHGVLLHDAFIEACYILQAKTEGATVGN